jgi:hypothetical protein
MEGSLVAYKVFTNGSTLQASEINDNLMRQSVMVFSNAAARTAAITVPLEGMLTWLEDLNRYESYNGSAWVSPDDFALVGKTTFTAVSTFSVDNVFSSLYSNYRVLFDISSLSAAPQINFRLRAGGSDIGAGGTSYNWQNFYSIGSSSFRQSSTANLIELITGVGGNSISMSLDVFNPFTTVSTRLAGVGHMATACGLFASGSYTPTTSADGFTISASTGTITGNVKIYGYKD